MPRPNRYHPYTRPQSSSCQPGSSPRYPEPAPFRRPEPLPKIEEYGPTNHQFAPQPQAPYNSKLEPPRYITLVTTNGTPLESRSIVHARDGGLHIVVEAVRFPSEYRTNHLPSSQASIAKPNYHFDPQLVNGSPNLSAQIALMGLRTPDLKHSTASSESGTDIEDNKSFGVRDDDCAIVTDDEDDVDAEGEIDMDNYGLSMILEQRKTMLEMCRRQRGM